MADNDDDKGGDSGAAPADATRLRGLTDDTPVELSGSMPPGSLLSHTYEIEAFVARGGMGEVYRAHHVELGTNHAIKIIVPELAKNQKILDLFRREAAVLRNIRHQAIVGYDGVFRDEAGRVYLVMEFVDGPSLAQILAERALTVDEVRRLRDRLASGLADAHDQGIIHRDLSPDNIILPGGDIDKAKIIDFGIAKIEDPDVGTIVGGDFAGRYAYASPEQFGMFGGKVGARSDIYSLGLVLATAASGIALDMGKTLMTVIRSREELPDLSSIPSELVPELTALLQPDPEDRPANMNAILAAPGTVPPVEAGTPVDVSHPAPSEVAAPARSRNIVPVAAVVMVVAVLGAWAAWEFGLRDAVAPEPAPTAAVRDAAVGEATPPVDVSVTGAASTPVDDAGEAGAEPVPAPALAAAADTDSEAPADPTIDTTGTGGDDVATVATAATIDDTELTAAAGIAEDDRMPDAPSEVSAGDDVSAQTPPSEIVTAPVDASVDRPIADEAGGLETAAADPAVEVDQAADDAPADRSAVDPTEERTAVPGDPIAVAVEDDADAVLQTAAGEPPAEPPPASADAVEPEQPDVVASLPEADVTAAAASPAEDDVFRPDADQRRRMQTALQRLGLYRGGVDGILGPGTRSAVTAFQQQIGQSATGDITETQYSALLAAAAAVPAPVEPVRPTPSVDHTAAATAPDPVTPPAATDRTGTGTSTDSGDRAATAFAPDLLDQITRGRSGEGTGTGSSQGYVISVTQAIRPCWEREFRNLGVARQSVDLRLFMRRDRTVERVEIIDEARASGDADFRTAAEAARRAVLDPRCQPLPLPEGDFNLWQSLRLRIIAG